MESPEKSPSFIEREVIPLRDGGEVELFVRKDSEGIFSYLINVRSPEEKHELEKVGAEYYERLNKDNTPMPITGSGGTEGLHIALNYLKDLVEKLRDSGAKELWIDGDDRRMQVYRKILIPMGFEETLRVNGGPALIYHFQ